ncbi:hypothetical protein GDO81_002818 [Engystomops pustulosus]|uniref:Uncharacterized protein n=1 Tax=Engystomops pustulosus TaxID=76066 RepID=A0AAV7DN31_ENGPU|nr:hypothetical protein GDO81_002818 [Engystomops pustulosus]
MFMNQRKRLAQVRNALFYFNYFTFNEINHFYGTSQSQSFSVREKNPLQSWRKKDICLELPIHVKGE